MRRTSIFIFIFTIITSVMASAAQEVKLPLADFEVKAGPESARVVQSLRFTLYDDSRRPWKSCC